MRSTQPALRCRWKAIDRYSQDYVELQTKDNVKFYKTRIAILQKAARTLRRDRVEESGGKSAVQGDHGIAARLSPAGDAMGAGHRRPRKMAFDHYFGPNAKPIRL
jgi:hypothetical protein